MGIDFVEKDNDETCFRTWNWNQINSILFTIN